MSLSLSDLITPLTTDQVLETFLSTLEAMGVRARSWRPGGSLRTILKVVAGVWAAFTALAVQFIQGGFLDLALGGWLTLLAHNVYGVDRVEATFATGTVTLTNAGGGVYPVAAGGLIVTSSTLNKAYTNTASFTLNALSSLDVPIQAVELGSASSATPGEIDTVQTSLPGVTVTNAAAVVGTDAEDDDTLKQRCRDKLGTLSGLGPRGAYGFAIRSAVRADGSTVDVNRMSISSSSSTGIVTIYVASVSGTVSGGDLTYISDSIEKYARPDTVTVNLNSATVLPISQTLDVWANTTPGLTSGQLTQLVQDALLAMVTAYPIGGRVKPPSVTGYLFGSHITAAALDAHSSIFAVDGAADAALTAGQVAQLATTINIHFVDPVEGS